MHTPLYRRREGNAPKSVHKIEQRYSFEGGWRDEDAGKKAGIIGGIQHHQHGREKSGRGPSVIKDQNCMTASGEGKGDEKSQSSSPKELRRGELLSNKLGSGKEKGAKHGGEVVRAPDGIGRRMITRVNGLMSW